MPFSVDLVLEHLGGLEHGGVAGSDVDSRAVGRVTALMLITRGREADSLTVGAAIPLPGVEQRPTQEKTKPAGRRGRRPLQGDGTWNR